MIRGLQSSSAMSADSDSSAFSRNSSKIDITSEGKEEYNLITFFNALFTCFLEPSNARRISLSEGRSRCEHSANSETMFTFLRNNRWRSSDGGWRVQWLSEGAVPPVSAAVREGGLRPEAPELMKAEAKRSRAAGHWAMDEANPLWQTAVLMSQLPAVVNVHLSDERTRCNLQPAMKGVSTGDEKNGNSSEFNSARTEFKDIWSDFRSEPGPNPTRSTTRVYNTTNPKVFLLSPFRPRLNIFLQVTISGERRICSPASSGQPSDFDSGSSIDARIREEYNGPPVVVAGRSPGGRRLAGRKKVGRKEKGWSEDRGKQQSAISDDRGRT
ncbi:hypothetical protein LXL04_014743 [Taraxacum kok-saghyz]